MSLKPPTQDNDLYITGRILLDNSGYDVVLYRDAANTLKTDDSFVIGGSGAVILAHDSTPTIFFGASSDTNLYRGAANVLKTDDSLYCVGDFIARVGLAGKVAAGAVGPAGAAGLTFGSADDVNLYRSAANALKTDDSLIVGDSLALVATAGVMELKETSEPAAPAANFAYFYCRDNGSGKTQIVARFPTGAVQVIATEP